MCVYQGCGRHVDNEIRFFTSEHDVTSPLHALHSLVQQNSLEKCLNPSASVPGSHIFRSCHHFLPHLRHCLCWMNIIRNYWITVLFQYSV